MRGYSTKLDWHGGPDQGWWVELLKEGVRVAYMSRGEWKSLGATQQAIEDGGHDGEGHSPQSRVTGAAFAAPEEDEMPTEPDVQRLIKELAETGADPFWVHEAVAIEQEAVAAAARSKAAAGSAPPPRPRPQLRVVVADRE